MSTDVRRASSASERECRSRRPCAPAGQTRVTDRCASAATRRRPRARARRCQPVSRRLPPPQARRRRGHPLVVVLNGSSPALVVVAGRCGRGIACSSAAQFEAARAADEPTSVDHRARERTQARSPSCLQREGVDRRSPWSSVAGRSSQRREDKLKAGEYLFQASASMQRGAGHRSPRQGGPAFDHRPRGPDQRADRRAPAGRTMSSPATSPRCRAKAADAGHLQVHARHDAPGRSSTTCSGPARGPRRDLGARAAGPADQHAGGARHAGLDRREGDRPRR